jgi:2-deoxy-D-gluconate 3-dehydrogenase
MKNVEFPDFRLTGKTALVTGASKGIGRHTALTLAHAGADVILTARDEPGLQETAGQIRSLNRKAEIITADLAHPEEIRALARQALQKSNGIDILINNAGISFPESALETKLEHWDLTLEVNLRAPFLLSQLIGRHMIEKGGGKIINIASQAGIVALADHAAYCASKAGLILLTKVLAVEWGPHNIQVNAVAPTVILTPMAEKAWADEKKSQAMLAKIPLGRFGKPVEVSGAVLFLASSASDLVTGEVLVIDGGYTAQ